MTASADPGVTLAAPTSNQANNDAAPPAATPTEALAPTSTRMLERLKSLRTAQTTDRKVPEGDIVSDDAQHVSADDTDAGASPESEGVIDEPSKDKKKEPDSIPLKAFQARVGKLTEKNRSLQEQVLERDHDVALHKEALKVMTEELQRYRKLAQEGTPLDERDETIRNLQLQAQLTKREQELLKNRDEARRNVVDEDAGADIREQFKADTAKALEAHPMVHARELYAELGKKQNQSRAPHEVAAELELKKLEIARSRLVSERPASPSTARARIGGAAQVRHAANKDGMLARLAELKALNR